MQIPPSTETVLFKHGSHPVILLLDCIPAAHDEQADDPVVSE